MMSTWTLSVCHGPSSGIATAHASHFLQMDRTAGQRRMRLIFFACGSVCYYGYCLSSVLISELVRKPSSK